MSSSKNRFFKLVLISQAKWIFPFVFIALAVSSFLGIQVPFLINDLFENFKTAEAFYPSLYELLGVFSLVYLNRIIYGLLINKYVQYLIEHVRSYCYAEWIQHYNLIEEEKKTKEFPLGEVIARVMNDTESIKELVTSGTFGIFIDFCFIISGVVAFISINQEAGYFLIALQLVAGFLLFLLSRLMAKVFLGVRKANGIMARTVGNIAGGLRETYYNKHAQYASRKGESSFKEFMHKQIRANVWDASYYAIAESLFPLFLLSFAFLLPYAEIREAATVAVLIDLLQRSINPVKDFTGKIGNIQRAASGYTRIKEFLNFLQGQPQSSHTTANEKFHLKKIVIKLNSFHYPQNEGREDRESLFSLNEINTEFLAGETIGLAGMSGSGKSTFLKILSGAIIPKDASIEVIGEQSTLSLPSLGEDFDRYRRLVGIVSQDSHVFSESLAFNISLQTEISDSLKSFWAKSVTTLPYLKTWAKKLEDQVELNDLSVGQKQLISGLRACFLEKPIVLLDEISSALDSELEESLRLLVKDIQQKSLTIIVAHRIETIMGADRILVMEHGRLVAENDHEQLLKDSETYQRFIEQISTQVHL